MVKLLEEQYLYGLDREHVSQNITYPFGGWTVFFIWINNLQFTGDHASQSIDLLYRQLLFSHLIQPDSEPGERQTEQQDCDEESPQSELEPSAAFWRFVSPSV